MKVTRDHQVPRSRGGETNFENLVIACLRCNLEKANMDVETYRWFLEDKRAAGMRVVFYGERVPQPWYL